MSDGLPPEDPFGREDPEAAEREARRREREERRRAREERRRSESNQRSLADRVGGALGGARGAVRGGESQAGEPPLEDPPAAREPRGEEPPRPPRSSGVRRVPWSFGAGGGAADGRTLIIRRVLAAGAVVGALALVVLLVRAVGGGDESAPVAAEPALETTSVVIPEGLTIEQIGRIAKKAKLKGNYEKAVNKAMKDFPLKRYDAKGAPSMEGFLFPATYEVEKRAPVKDLVGKQLDAFRRNFDGVNLKKAKKKNLNAYDVLIIASMIEEEVQVADERRKVAAVIYNRLAAGDTLGIDATLRYELGNYDEQLKQSELQADTPYNTRVNAGLPPTPIANPGLASIEAAANPANSDAYYFVIKPGTCGEHVFADNEADFLAAQADYQEALAEQGGSPTDCG